MMIYILIGIIFMFFIEYLLNRKTIQKQLRYTVNLGWTERIIGVFFWPICLGIFLYNFFKEIFK